jgi:cob(I)alamin adenosyltransferase
MKIYTKTGDDGATSLFAGGRVRKDHPRVEAYGTVDELNALLGLVRAHDLPAPAPDWLEGIQNDLFVIGADLATPLDAKVDWLARLDDSAAQRLESHIDRLDEDLPLLRHFILPGGTPAAAHLHVARTVCRRAERIGVTLSEAEKINPNVLIYLNRLSDFLFTLARWVNLKMGENETKWAVRSDR